MADNLKTDSLSWEMLIWPLEQCKPERGALSHCVVLYSPVGRVWCPPQKEACSTHPERVSLLTLQGSCKNKTAELTPLPSPGHCLIYPHNTSEKEVRNRQMSQVSTVRVKGGGVFVPLDWEPLGGKISSAPRGEKLWVPFWSWVNSDIFLILNSAPCLARLRLSSKKPLPIMFLIKFPGSLRMSLNRKVRQTLGMFNVMCLVIVQAGNSQVLCLLMNQRKHLCPLPFVLGL